jgi:predicted metalloprotease with PDZ domain
VVIAFSGEELGLLGSASFVKDAPIPIDSIHAMINMDMVGRLSGRSLAVFGANSATEFPAILEDVNRAYNFELNASGDGYGRSDHSSFYVAGRPVVHFFTGTHEDYHRTTDDWDKLNLDGIAEVARFASDLALVLAARPEPLTYVEAPPPTPVAGGGYGAYLGTIPDMTENPGGVRLTGVRSGSPADRAGLTAGDVIVKIGEFEIGDLYDMTDALRSHRPGDTVWLVARREDGEVRVRVTFGRRGG